MSSAMKLSFGNLPESGDASKSDFNHLIMDYLVSQGYPQAAARFALEANMPTASDLDIVTQRANIRDSIYAGKIQSAIEQINEIDPQLLDHDLPLHFALLRLQLIELIRTATSNSEGDVTPALEFATTHLAPRAVSNADFLQDMERTMALLIFPSDNLTPELSRLLRPEIRMEIAKRVNEALLRGRGEQAQAVLNKLVRQRVWTHQLALKDMKEYVDEELDFGLDSKPKPTNGQDVAMAN